jgi:hypothetical protein
MRITVLLMMGQFDLELQTIGYLALRGDTIYSVSITFSVALVASLLLQERHARVVST